MYQESRVRNVVVGWGSRSRPVPAQGKCQNVRFEQSCAPARYCCLLLGAVRWVGGVRWRCHSLLTECKRTLTHIVLHARSQFLAFTGRTIAFLFYYDMIHDGCIYRYHAVYRTAVLRWCTKTSTTIHHRSIALPNKLLRLLIHSI